MPNSGTSSRSPSVDPESISMEIRPYPRKKERSFSQVDTRLKKGCVPLFFERASSSFWNPKFDSDILEKEFQRFTFKNNKRRLIRALMYVLVVAVTWGIFLGITYQDYTHWWKILLGDLMFALVIVAILLFIHFSESYRKYSAHVSFIAAICLLAASLATLSFSSEFYNTARFSICTCFIMVIYTFFHTLRLYVCFFITTVFSIVHEVLHKYLSLDQNRLIDQRVEIPSILLLHACIHLVGINIFFMAQVRERSTFWKVGQSVAARRDLEIEKQVKESMVRSVMPEKVADSLLSVDNEDDHKDRSGKDSANGKRKHRKAKIVFRSFQMHRMENVSILFADIVGFTKMSSNKSADQLVRLLNDLFGRFDRLTEINNCEKISTLGDCYYCVAGCPKETKHHAIYCVEMGLDMLEQIKEFDHDTNNDVDMRVGVHTGTVLCGIVGTKRFKFDVWSNDVTLANRMETASLPGKVHITADTLSFLNDKYVVEDGHGESRHTGLKDITTYFIKGRKNGLQKPFELSNPQSTKASSSTCTNSSNAASSSSKPKKHVKISDNVLTSDGALSSDSISNQEDATILENGPRKGNLKAPIDQIERDYLKSDAGTMEDDEEESRHSMVGKGIERGTSQQKILGLSFPEALTRETLRTSNDQQLVKLMSEQRVGEEYFHAAITPYTLQFGRKDLERQYRNEGQDSTLLNPSVTTFASPKVNFFTDVLLSNIVYFFISALCLILFRPIPLSKMILTPLAFLLEFTLFLLNFARAFPRRFPEWVHPLVVYTSGWCTSHLVGTLLMCLPYVSVFTNFMDCDHLIDNNTRHFFTYIVAVTLLHFCNFTQLTSWIKTGFAGIFAATYLILLQFDNFCAFIPIASNNNTSTSPQIITNGRQMASQVTVAVILLWVLVALLNRQLEIGVRRNFSGDAEAAKDKKKSQSHKQQVDLLLFSLFPKHVSDALKVSDHYSRNYEEVGVMFASIVNFSDFYEESFEGGKECIRVLNELVGDFDELLDNIEFDKVEKIKTVNGSTFMAGAGLNSEGHISKDVHPNEHLKQLIEFALEMMDVVHRFNEHMLGFKFELRTGYNAGPVTAGVIGTTKLLYDIWGDTVNLASRMDSTGVAFKIQVSETTKDKLSEFFTFSFRGTIPVKGKGYVTTYLLDGRIEDVKASESAE